MRRIFLSPISMIAYLAIGTPFVIVFSRSGDAIPLIVYATVILTAMGILEEFIRDVLESPDRAALSTDNIAEYLSSETLRILGCVNVWTGLGLLKVLTLSRRGAFLVREMGLSVNNLLDKAQGRTEGQVHLPALIAEGRKMCSFCGEERVTPAMLLSAVFSTGGVFEEILNEQDLSREDVKKMVQYESFHERLRMRRKNILHPDTLLKRFGAMGRSWVKGYTGWLDRLTEDIGPTIRWSADRGVKIHTQVIENTLRIFARSAQHNVLLIGKSGTGKRTLAQNIAFTIRTLERQQGRSDTRLRVLREDMLLSGTASPDEALLRAFGELKGMERALLIIDDVPLLLQTCDPKLKAVLIKIFDAPNINVLGIADAKGYHEHVRADASVDRSFEPVRVDDSSDDETMFVLMEHLFQLEGRSRLTLTYRSLRQVVDLAKRYVGAGGFPGKAVEIINDAWHIAQEERRTFIGEDDVRKAISVKAHMDIQEIGERERERLLKLKGELAKRIVGQEEATDMIVHALKRARLEIGTRNKPSGTFLFLGPTGVGKTHTAKTIADVIFGGESAFIRLDMNEYALEQSLERVIGELSQRIQDRPFSLILLDEIEKAHPKVLNTFLQILDEGILTDTAGVKIDFRNTIIIATSNAGALFIRDFVTSHPEWGTEDGRSIFKQQLTDFILKEKLFSPEFINRFDEVIVYYPMTPVDAKKIAVIMLDEVIREFKEEKGITIILEESVLETIVERGYSIEFGARAMRRTITDAFENYLADYMLEHEVKRGDTIRIGAGDMPAGRQV
ncbi:ATP-dependent Clp protease ATP-binding subunit [Candidatus Peregrinibacteria bacterium]|nr:ATP-dependent Clp protease ATP-binding subunit [Candidatus Peregrinibacteria bacterium]